MSEAPRWTAAEPAPFEEVDTGALLLGADELNAEEASRLLALAPARVVVWMGERDSGKTTLTTQLYERQRRAGEGTRFAGSRTLLAFEQLVHPGRAGPGRVVARPRRTELDPEGREILHLALDVGEARVHLLLADLPGEVFRQLADNQLATSAIPLLRRADKLAVLVDGARLCEHDTRASVLTRARQLVERLQTDALRDPSMELALVVTKWDRVDREIDALDYWQPREEQLLAELRALDPHARHLRVAAGAPAGYPHDDGFAALREWLVAPGAARIDPPLAPYHWPDDAPARLRRPWSLA